MNINCIICSDFLTPQSEIYVTKCGHTFHYHCLIQWIERSKTCPQCRTKTTEKNLFRVYFNIVNSDSIEDDAVTLQNKLDSLKLQLHLKDSFIKTSEDEIKNLRDEFKILQEAAKDMTKKVEKYKSGNLSLKDQVNFYKEKVKYNERLENEIRQLKETLRAQEQANIALTGSFEDAEDVINNCECPKTLSMIASSLKKELKSLEKRKYTLFCNFKRVEKELSTTKKEMTNMKKENEILNSQLSAHKQCESELAALRLKIGELIEKNKEENPSLVRLVTESPAPFLTKPKKKDLKNDDSSFEEVNSPSVSVRIQDIKDSDSPYLQIKPSGMGLLLQSEKMKSKFGFGPVSIMKNQASSTCVSQTEKPISKGSYNGLGGYSCNDVFPVPKPTGLKRPKSTKMTTSKFRKLAKPTKKLEDFLNISD